MDELLRVESAWLDDLVRALPPMGDWVERAACARLGPGGGDVFTQDHPDPEERALAQRVCARCPVRDDCADYAQRVPVFGLWGGRWYSQRAGQKVAA